MSEEIERREYDANRNPYRSANSISSRIKCWVHEVREPSCGNCQSEAATPSPDLKAENAALVALQMVEDAMRRRDGQIIGYGWNITALNKARPFIHAALQSVEKV